MATGIVKFVIQTTAPTVQIQAYGAALHQVGNTAQQTSTRATSAFSRMEANLNKMRSAIIGFIGAFVFTRAIRGFAALIQAGIDFESSFAGIRKTVDAFGNELALLQIQMRQLAKEIPIGVNALNRIGEIAGQIGVPTRQIRNFTETIAKIGLATDLSVDEAATNFARLANILGLPIEKIKSLASVIVDLGNKEAATEQEILAFSMNIAGAGKQVGLSGEQIAALSTALAATGLHAEKAGSSMSRIMISMAQSVSAGGKKLEQFAQVAGVSARDFAAVFKDDAAKALLLFLEGLNTVEKRGGDTFKVLEALSLQEIRVRDVTLRAKEAYDVFERSLRNASIEAGKNGKALDTEVNKRLETTEAQLDRVKARLYDVAISFSDSLKPSVISAGKALADAAEFLRQNEHALGLLIKTIGGVGLALGGLKLAAYLQSLATAAKTVFALEAALASAAGIAAGKFAISLAAANKAADLLWSNPLFRVTSIVALAVSVGQLADAWLEYEDAISKQTKAESDRYNAVIRASKELERQGLMTTAGKSFRELEAELVKLGQMMAEIGKISRAEDDDKKKRDEEHLARLKIISEEEEKRRGRINEMKSAVTGATSKDKEWLIALRELVEEGANINQVMDEYRGRIEDYIERQRMAGTALSGIMSLMEDWITLQKDANRELEFAGGIIDAQIKKEHEWLVQRVEIAKALESASKFPLPLNVQQSRAGTDFLLSPQNQLNRYSFGTGGFNTGISRLAPESIINQRTADKAAEKVSDSMERELTRAIDRVFDRLIREGELAWKDIAKFVSEIFEPLGQELFAPLKQTLLKPLQDMLGNLGERITGIFKGGTGGTGLGSKLTGLLGSAASAGIGAAVSLGINAIAGLFRRSGSEVNNNIVQNIQNPFADAVVSLMQSFQQANTSGRTTLRTAIDARTQLTALWAKFRADVEAYGAQSVTHQRAAFGAMQTIQQHWGEGLITLFGEIDTVIESLGGTAGMTVEQLEELNEAIQEMEAFNNAVQDMVDSVTANAAQVDITTAALERLREAGIPTDLILGRLGDAIVEMAEELRILGREVPAIVSEFEAIVLRAREVARAEEEAAEQMEQFRNRLLEVRDQLTGVSDSIEDAFIRKLEFLEREISKSNQALESWRTEISKINERITETRNRLSDAEYWNKRYADSIKDSESALRDATRDRESIEKEIADLTKEIEERRLNDIVRNSRNASMVKLAELALQRMEQQEIQDKIARLQELKKELPRAIQLEQDAIVLFGQKRVAAKAAIDAEREELEISIISMERERAELEKNILMEQAHVQSLIRDREEVERSMLALGIVRLTEIEQINSTIVALQLRQIALREEEAALQRIVGVVEDLTVSTGMRSNIRPNPAGGGSLLTSFGGGVPMTQAMTLTNSMPQNTGMFNVGSPPPGFAAVSGFPFPTRADGVPIEQSTRFAYLRRGDNQLVIDSPTDVAAFLRDIRVLGTLIGAFEHGTDYVPRTGPAIVHQGEAIIPASENRKRGMSDAAISIRIGELNISGASGAQSGRDAADAFVRKLETDGNLARRIRKLVTEAKR